MPKKFSIRLTGSSIQNDNPATYIVFGSPRGGTTMVAKVLQELSIDLGGINANLEDPKFNTDYMILDHINKYIKVIHFTGMGKTIHNCKSKTIKENWK